MTDRDEYLTETELSERLKIPVTTLRTWRSRQAGPPFTKIGPRSVRYSWLEAVAYMKRRTVGRGAAA